ncbi:resolvase, N terminal domain protein [Pseudarthrobacter siccitolerans]|uniref:Resolvase, N terminal domain protein n=1 Tax=Pseudarthrobacter siccitolerans TaxID=861266 RepID=A0A024GXJ3_9MICC|nr:recombinase family protein [Pseudarthrobacter siccitolerans]CCQ44342.1 resolvase, N terminal domain protein [Pseudarthrobacter siccitolerans]
MKLRAILYLRLSVSDDASTSIARQERDLRELAEREDWEIVAVLTDDGISGRKVRANALEALRQLRTGEADVLAVWKLDRWTRQGLSAVGDLVDTLDSRKGEALFVALKDGLRSDQPAWRMIAVVLAETARTEAENTALRAKSSFKTLRHGGRFSGGMVPYGYRTAPAPDGPGRVLEVDPAEAKIVREIADRILDGESLTKITTWLNVNGIPSAKSEYRKALREGRPADGADRGTWYLSTIKAVWTADHLLGRVIHNGSPVQDEHGLPKRIWEPILDLSTLTSLRARLDPPRGTGPKARSRAARLLSGLLFCAYCDMKLYVRSSGGRPIYGCPSSAKGTVCASPRVVAQKVEDYVAERFLALVGDLPEIEEHDVVTDPGTVEALAEVELAIRDTSAALADDDADLATLLDRLAVLKERRTDLKNRPAAIEKIVKETGRTLREAWEATDDVDKRRKLLMEGIDHVRVSSRTRRGNIFEPDRLKILWRS